MDNDKIGAFIKELRIKNHMTQKELADKIPINRESVSKWECGRTIPDSATILILSNIFHISADEIMYGEYKTSQNEKDLNNLQFQIFDNRNAIYHKLKKISRWLIFISFLLFSVIISFLIYYFINSYNSVNIYTIAPQQEDIYFTDGILVVTTENIYFRLGNINGIDEDKISKISLYYKKADNNRLIYESSSPKDTLIKTYYGYNEYFENKNKDVILDDIYVDIYFEDMVKTLKLNFKKEYSYKKLFFKKYTNGTLKNTSKDDVKETKLMHSIKETFIQKETGIYNYKIEIDTITYDLLYLNMENILFVVWNDATYNNLIQYDVGLEQFVYTKNNNKKNYSESCFSDSKDSVDICDVSIKNTLDSVINKIISLGS